AGDRFLKEVAAKWRDQLRESDVVARLGGDEFAMLLTSCTLEAAQGIMGRLCSELPEAWTCSAGVGAWDGRESGSDLTARADAALYRAKDAGRNRIEVAERADGDHAAAGAPVE